MTKTILALLNDLFLLPRIEDVAASKGYHVRHLSTPQDLGISGDHVKRVIPLTEPLDGPDAVLVREVSAIRPALILIDANAQGLPWSRWIQVLKTSAATRRIPILVFGPHVAKTLLDKARSLGADAVVSRGVFNKQMGDLILSHSRPDHAEGLERACEGVLAQKARQGIALHNLGEYYQAHELLEEAWMSAPELEGYLYRSLLQLTVTHLHISRGNLRGAKKMALRIHQWLDPLPDVCREVDVADLKNRVSALRQAVNAGQLPVGLQPIQIRLISYPGV